MRLINITFGFLLISFFSIGFVFAASSKSNTTYYIESYPGCGNLGEGQCSEDGNFICVGQEAADAGLPSPLISTTENPNVCAIGLEGTEDEEGIVQGGCCPNGYSCKRADDGAKQGSIYGCIRITDVEPPKGHLCNVYDNRRGRDACINNIDGIIVWWPANVKSAEESYCGLNVRDGSVMIGSIRLDVEGAYRLECSCEWDESPGSGEFFCYNSVEAVCVDDDYCNEDPADDNPRCRQRPKKISECSGNKQAVEWETFAEYSNGTRIILPINSNDPNYELFEDIGCLQIPPEVRSCGEPTIALPGFSTFALISSITLIIFIYILRSRKKDN